MAEDRFDADVIVVGGGPAGSTAATMLTRKGHRVLLLEKELFPREHIGESLLPASLPILEALGVLPAIEAAGFLKKYGATMVWGSGDEPWSWHFRETNRTHPHAYQVWRPLFDKILLDHSAALGADVRQGCRVTDLHLRGQEEMRVEYTQGGVARVARGRFVVDASGQAGLIGRKLGLRRPDEQFQNLAVYGYFEGCERLPPPDETNIFIESYEYGWFWMIPLHTGQMSVGAVVDHRHGSDGIRELGLEAFLRQQIATAPHAARMLRDATLASGPHVIRDWSYVSDEVTGDGWVLAGDAACFIDPLFSTGVHLALSAGALAAAYVTTALKDQEMARAAGAAHKELYYSQYNLFRQLAGMFYATNRSVESYFWEARRILDDEGADPRSAFIRAVAGQPPKGYERVVLERGEAPAGLVEGIAAVVDDRARRKAAYDEALRREGEGGTAVHAAVPIPGAELRVERRPILGDGEFAWGDVLLSAARPEGMPVSPFVARLVGAIDGVRTTAEVIACLADEAGTTRAAITGNVLAALGILFADGAIDGLATAGQMDTSGRR